MFGGSALIVGHAWDLMPSYANQFPTLCGSGSYKDVAYVRNEVRKLAAQLAAVDGFMEVIKCPFCAKQPERNIATTTCEDCCGSGQIRQRKAVAHP